MGLFTKIVSKDSKYAIEMDRENVFHYYGSSMWNDSQLLYYRQWKLL